ncbi:MAG: prolyl-tRNA synthetase [Candidatus Zambryskibacteria bacterium]|nr:prolyl-tRNA synthetase [Candidatus Zambryskibacteria bacterium]
MRQSHLFTKTRREAPKDEEAKNAQLLIRGGFINKEMAGVYSFLPLGFNVIKNIKKIVAEEMEKLNSQEIIMSTLQNKETWEKTDRWNDEKVDIWFKSIFKNGSEVGLGWSHEEPIVEMMKSHISSYQDLPVTVHQFQNKLRNEARAKSGIMRCREFIMKDMYSFALTEENNAAFYNKVIDAYLNIFRRAGLGEMTFVTSASGGVFTDEFSHEFQTICDAGEDNIYVHKNGKLALNEEIFNDKTLKKLGAEKSDFEMKKTAEIGNIFNFGTKKSEQLGLYIKDRHGQKKAVFLSSYGIGITRLMGTIVEVLSDKKGIVWPEEIAPFHIHLLSLSERTKNSADKIYEALTKEGVEVLYDDRDIRAGEKFADADLIGIPRHVIMGDKFSESGMLEVKDRSSDDTKKLTLAHLVKKFKK